MAKKKTTVRSFKTASGGKRYVQVPASSSSSSKSKSGSKKSSSSSSVSVKSKATKTSGSATVKTGSQPKIYDQYEAKTVKKSNTPSYAAKTVKKSDAPKTPAKYDAKTVSKDNTPNVPKAYKAQEYNGQYKPTEYKSTYKPGEYNSEYKAQLDAARDRLTNWQYDPMQDANYQALAKVYAARGNIAAKNSLADAAALNGGFGTSYAVSAAQQARNQYNQELAALTPELEQMAYQRAQGTYDTLMGADNTAYGRFRDTEADRQWQESQNFNAWNANEGNRYNAAQFGLEVAGFNQGERQYANQDKWNRYNAKTEDFWNRRNFNQGERQFAYNSLWDRYNANNENYWNRQNFNQGERQFAYNAANDNYWNRQNFNQGERQFAYNSGVDRYNSLTSNYQWAKEFNNSQNQWQTEFNYNKAQDSDAVEQWKYSNGLPSKYGTKATGGGGGGGGGRRRSGGGSYSGGGSTSSESVGGMTQEDLWNAANKADSTSRNPNSVMYYQNSGGSVQKQSVENAYKRNKKK